MHEELKRSKKSELLIGVMIGIYGNWLIAVVEKLEKIDLSLKALFAFSFVLFFAYFLEVFTEIEKHRWFTFMPLKYILGFFYLFLVCILLILSGIWSSDFLFSLTGVSIWLALMLVERRALA